VNPVQGLAFELIVSPPLIQGAEQISKRKCKPSSHSRVRADAQLLEILFVHYLILKPIGGAFGADWKVEVHQSKECFASLILYTSRWMRNTSIN
jgi:hypothetical protein